MTPVSVNPKPPFSGQKGMTLIELLVAVGIGLIATVFMFQSIIVSEGYRRVATAGGDSQSNGSLAMFVIQQDVRNAGYGLSFVDQFGSSPISLCASSLTVAFLGDAPGSSTGRRITFDGSSASSAMTPFAPFVINPPGIPSGDANTDVIQIVFSGATLTKASTPFSAGYLNSSVFILESTRTGFSVGDLVLAAGVPVGLPVGARPVVCSLFEVTQLPTVTTCTGGPGNGKAILHSPNETAPPYDDPEHGCATVTPSPRWNSSAGLSFPLGGATYPVAYSSANASTVTLFNLGPRPPENAASRFRFYAIRNRKLTQCDLFVADCTDATKVSDTTVWVPVSDDVVSLRAEYGLDNGAGAGTAGDQVVDAWVHPDDWAHSPLTTPQEWSRLLAVRFSVVSKGKEYSKTAITGCADSSCIAAPSWTGGVALDVSKLPNGADDVSWDHYRYRTFESIVPMRNLIWK